MSASRLASALFFIFLTGASADETAESVVAPEITITGKRLRGDHRSARVYTETELARESGRTIGEVLREGGGVDYLVGTGGNSNLLIRGASGSQTLVIIDGVKANDPSATNRYFDWSRIDATQIERVEILKGPQAVSYGSDAIGGVVLITTKRGEARPGSVATTASVEAGSETFARSRGSAAVDLGSRAGADHSLGLQALGKAVFDGYSSALSPTGAPTEGDSSREASAGFALKSKWARTRTALVADLRAAREEIDAGAFDDDPNSVARNREIRGSATAEGTVGEDTEWGTLVSHLDFRRAYSDFADPAHAFASDTILRGSNSRGEIHFRSGGGATAEWAAGFEANRETLRIDSLLFPTRLSRDHAETYAFFAETSVPFDAARIFSVDFGARLSHFTSFGNQRSEKFGLSYRPREFLEFDAGVSTGFKAPSLYSLYDPTYGNPDLKPEESIQIEGGSAVKFAADSTLSARGFTSRVRDRFGYDSSFRSLNVARARIRGVELDFDHRLSATLRVSTSLTYLSSHDEATGRSLPDVPRWKHGLKLAVDFAHGHAVTLSLVGKSDRESSAGGQRVAGFTRVNLTTRHGLGNGWNLTTRFENLLDRDYEEVRGYRSPGVSAYAGLEFVSL